jgi:hypothetical protein
MITVVASVAIACTVPAAAYAGNEDMGTLVEYAMEFPVSGDPWFYDGFWEPRREVASTRASTSSPTRAPRCGRSPRARSCG